MDKTGKSIKK